MTYDQLLELLARRVVPDEDAAYKSFVTFSNVVVAAELFSSFRLVHQVDVDNVLSCIACESMFNRLGCTLTAHNHGLFIRPRRHEH